MTVSLALTKGRLERKTVDMLERSGYGIEPLRNQGRQLVFEDTQKDLKYFLVKSNDCLTYVMQGVADAGVVGKDTILEGPKDYYEVLDLKIGVCKFIVAALPETDLLNRDGHLRIGTKYPNVATKYFNDRGMDVEIIKIDGSVELSPLLGLCDGIVDIMETGTTLKENGLVVLDDVAPVSARLIVNKAAFRTKKQEILELVRDLSREVDREQALKKEKEEGTC